MRAIEEVGPHKAFGQPNFVGKQYGYHLEISCPNGGEDLVDEVVSPSPIGVDVFSHDIKAVEGCGDFQCEGGS